MRNTGVIVLAGDRGPEDPLAQAARVPGKALVDVCGKPMLTRVMETVASFSGGGQVIVVCRDHPDYAAAADIGHPYRRVDPAAGPARSVIAAMEQIEGSGPVLVVTGDHPVLQPAWLEQFVEQAEAAGADAAVGLVKHAAVVERFPGNRRTRYRFLDGARCGTNLFYFAGSGGTRAAEFWQIFEDDRKRPWKVVARLGVLNLVHYLLGRLSVDKAMAVLSKRMGLSVHAVLLAHPEAAVDVDSPADLALVKRVIEARERRGT